MIIQLPNIGREPSGLAQTLSLRLPVLPEVRQSVGTALRTRLRRQARPTPLP
ncbi:MAG: hypothetical protein ACYDHM_12115 [Acidiferrobacterales bacterium]